MMERPTVKVLKAGRLVRRGTEIVEASSSVTLVESAGHRIIVDTGSSEDTGELVQALDAVRVGPTDVGIVVNTHLHSDHIGGNNLFTKARFYAHKLESPPVGTAVVSSKQKLLPGIEIVPSPGHTLGSISVLVTAERRYAICGDAIPTKANYDQRIPPYVNVDRRLALKSMELLLGIADVIVPGHDAIFNVEGKR